MIQGIKNIIKWAPIIWRDRDYDYEPLLTILEFKLRNMAAEHDTTYFANKKKTSRRMRHTAAICARIKASNYLRKQLDEQHLEAHFKDHTVELTAKYMPTYEALTKRAEQIQKHDLESLGKMITKNLTRWWS